MGKIEVEREIKYRTYKTRNDISSFEELSTAIIAFEEVYYCIFRYASNPRIEIRFYSPEAKESLLCEIDTKFQRNVTSSIEWNFTRMTCKNDIIKSFEDISEVLFVCNGAYIKYREFTIYSNSDVPWDSHNYRKLDWKKIKLRRK